MPFGVLLERFSFHIWLFKKSIHTLQNNVLHMLSFPYFVMGSHLGHGIGHIIVYIKRYLKAKEEVL